MWQPEDDRPRKPRAEPEILPPDAVDPRRRDPDPAWVRQRVYVWRPGPGTMLLGLAALAALGFLSAVLFVGLAIFLLPAAALALGVFAIAALLRGPRRL
jgi:fatty acid desaturase